MLIGRALAVAGRIHHGPDQMFATPQAVERKDGDQQQQQARAEEPIDAAPLRGCAAEERADDLPHSQEDRVEAHHRPTVVWMRLGHVGEQAERGWRCAGKYEEYHEQHDDRRGDQPNAPPLRVVEAKDRGHHGDPTGDAEADDGGPAHPLEAVAPVQEPAKEHNQAHADADAHLGP